VQSTMLRVFGTAFSFCHAQEQICPQIHGSVLRGTVLREGSRRFFSCGGGRARGGPRSHNVVLRSQGLFVPFGERRSRAWCAVALHCGRGLDEELNGAVSVWVVAVLCARPEGPGHGGDVKGGVFVGIWIPPPPPPPDPQTYGLWGQHFVRPTGAHHKSAARWAGWEAHSCVYQNILVFFLPLPVRRQQFFSPIHWEPKLDEMVKA